MQRFLTIVMATAMLFVAASASDFKTFVDVSATSTTLGSFTDDLTL